MRDSPTKHLAIAVMTLHRRLADADTQLAFLHRKAARLAEDAADPGLVTAQTQREIAKLQTSRALIAAHLEFTQTLLRERRHVDVTQSAA